MKMHERTYVLTDEFLCFQVDDNRKVAMMGVMISVLDKLLVRYPLHMPSKEAKSQSHAAA